LIRTIHKIRHWNRRNHSYRMNRGIAEREHGERVHRTSLPKNRLMIPRNLMTRKSHKNRDCDVLHLPQEQKSRPPWKEDPPPEQFVS